MTKPDHNEQPAPGPVDRRVWRPMLTENDCEDQGFSSISEGCNNWPCNGVQLVKWRHGYRCPKCGGCY